MSQIVYNFRFQLFYMPFVSQLLNYLKSEIHAYFLNKNNGNRFHSLK